MIIKAIFLVVYLITAALIMRYHVHMFQLNSYKMKESIVWIRKYAMELLGKTITIWIAMPILLCHDTYGMMIASALLVLAIFLNLPRTAKISLHYTLRVKRLMLTFSIFYLGLSVVIWCFLPQLVASILLLGLLVIIPYMVLFANICNKPIEKMISNYYVNDARRIINEMESLKVIGITGSYGKTSMKYILNELLSIQYNTLITPGNFNTTLGVVRTIREYLKPTHQIFICEMGAKNRGDIQEICDLVHPSCGIITSIGPQHLESFKTIETIIDTKFELVESLGTDGIAFLNYDNEYVKAQTTTKQIISYGVESVEALVKAHKITLSEKGSTFYVEDTDGVEVEFHTTLIGQHNVLNIIGAIAVARELGVPLKSMKQKVKRLKPVAHRLELRKHNDITIIDDAYNSNPTGAKMALDTLQLFEGYKILVTPGMVELGEKEEALNAEFGEHAASVADYIVLVGKKQAKPIYQGIERTDYDLAKVFIANDFKSAMQHVHTIATEQHKIVLLENDLPDNYN